MRLVRLVTAISCMLLLINPARGATSLLDVKLADLQQSQQVSLRELIEGDSAGAPPDDSVILLSFFEPNCPWCYRQMKVFNKMEAACNHKVQPVMVGINGNPRQLRKEIRKAKVKFPALKANKTLTKRFSVTATPWTFIVDSRGEVLAEIRGYVPLEQFADVFSHECEFDAS